jgi:hypothetical protein
MSFTLKGLPEFERKIKVLATLFPKAAKAALYLEAEFVMTDSKRNYVPVRDGILRSSGFVLPDSDPKVIRVTLGFGGPAGTGNVGGETNQGDVNYAIIQHENMDFAHKVGEAKYLERPLFAAIPKMGENISKAIAKSMGFS